MATRRRVRVRDRLGTRDGVHDCDMRGRMRELWKREDDQSSRNTKEVEMSTFMIEKRAWKGIDVTGSSRRHREDATSLQIGQCPLNRPGLGTMVRKTGSAWEDGVGTADDKKRIAIEGGRRRKARRSDAEKGAIVGKDAGGPAGSAEGRGGVLGIIASTFAMLSHSHRRIWQSPSLECQLEILSTWLQSAMDAATLPGGVFAILLQLSRASPQVLYSTGVEVAFWRLGDKQWI